jgi:hypothetical protein
MSSKCQLGSRHPEKLGGLSLETQPAAGGARHQTSRDKHKGWPAWSQEVGRDGAGPSTGQQPLPGFLTALLFEAVLGHPGNGRHHSQQRRGSCLNVSAPPHALAWGWRWEPGQGCLTLCSVRPPSPHSMSVLLSLPLASLVSNPSIPDKPFCPRSIPDHPFQRSATL